MAERQRGSGAIAAALLLMVSVAPLSAHEFKVAELEIVHPWARPTVAVQKNGAVYVTLRNHGATDDRLVGARTAEAAQVDVHDSTVTADGIARMRPQEGVVIAPASEVQLTPGGLHLMLVGLRGRLFEGTSFPLTLVFEHAGEVPIEVMVETNSSAGADHVDPSGHGAH